ADTLGGMGGAYEATGQYDEAVSSLLKAIEMWRKAGDNRGAAIESHQLGLIFLYQGRLGAALHAMQDAAKSLRDLGNRGRDMAEILNDLGNTLTKVGQGGEAAKPLEEAKTLARDLKNDSLQSAILNSEGDVQFYSGNPRPARALYEQALRVASKGTEHNRVLFSKFNLARAANADGKSQSVISDLRSLSSEADQRGIKF